MRDKSVNGLLAGALLIYVIFSPALVGTALRNYFVIPLFLMTLVFTKYRKIAGEKCCLLVLLMLLGWLFFSPLSVFFVENDNVELLSYFEQFFRVLVLLFSFVFVISLDGGLDRYVVRNVGAFFVVSSLVLYALSYAFPDVREWVFFLFYNHSDSDVYFSYMVNRPGLWIGNPNALALVAVLFFVYFLTMKDVGFRLAMMAGAVFIVLVTQSRTGMFCMAAVFVLWSFFEGNLKAVIVSFFVFLLISIFSAWLGFVDFEGLAYRYYSGINLAGRDEIWLQVLASVLDSEAYVFGYFVLPDDVGAIDSEYFNVFARYGLIGLSSFLGAFFFVLLFSFKRARVSVDMKIGFLLVAVFLLSSFASSPLTSLKLSIIFVMLLASSLSAYYVKRGGLV